MNNAYFEETNDTVYGQEQRLFAEMQDQARNCKRRQRRRRAVMWILRRL